MERFMYRVPDWNGEFRKVAAGWEEYQNLVRKFTFVEEARASGTITLFDASRNIRVLLPAAGGQSSYRIGNAPSWTPLVTVELIQRDFTQAQRATLKQDCTAARQRLDKVIARLVEVAVMPTAAMVDMRRKVRNVFHINIDAVGADLITEGVMFASLVANFKTLRSTGFDVDPPFVFEPDYTQSLVAWVVGVDDPHVHISPNHFFMDRENLILTLIHERAHTVLRLPGHPGGVQVPASPAEGIPTMTRDDAMLNAYCYEWLTAALQSVN